MKTSRTGSLSTGEVARRLSVTPDTVLKWVKLGKMPAIRTAGGHHRIEAEVVERLLRPECRAKEATGADPRRLRCWEYFNTDGQVREECTQCAAYQVRAGRCFELMRRDALLPGQRLFCSSSCEDCPYYQQVQGLPVRVLVITQDAELAGLLQSGAEGGMQVRVAKDVYGASAEVGTFLPSIVAMDAALPEGVFHGLAEALVADRRIPWARLAVIEERSGSRTPAMRGGNELARLSRSGLVDDLNALVHAKPVEQVSADATGG